MAFRQRVTAPSATTLTARFLVVKLVDTTLAFWAETVRGVLTPADTADGRSVVLLGESYERTNLAGRLGMREPPLTADSRFVLCGRGQGRCLVPVDHVLGLTDIQRQEIAPLSPLFVGEERRWFRGVFLFQNAMALVVNPDWLVHGMEAAEPALTSIP